MPDLSKRPARYLTFLVAAALAGGYVITQYGVRVGDDPKLAQMAGENAELRQQMASRVDQPPARSGLTCASFPNQQASQAYWAAHRTEYPDWDGNHNGLVCEQLRSSPSKPRAAALAAPARTPAERSHPAPGRTTVRTTVVPGPVRTRVVTINKIVTRNEPKAPVSKEPTPPPARPTAPDKASIMASRSNFGLYSQTDEEYRNVERTVSRQTTIHGYFQGWDTDFRSARVDAAWSQGQLPMLTWESRPLSGTDVTDDYSLASIAAGTHDDYLMRYATAIKANGLPLAIRFDHEMNGPWYRWAEENPDSGNAQGSYIAAWRHVHDVFEAAGANDLVIWVWAPNRTNQLHAHPAIDAYYPGDAYVDWMGLTAYFRETDRIPTFTSTFGETLGELRRVAPGKPILLAEVGATEDHELKVAWTTSFFQGVVGEPDVIGFLWFNYSVSEKGHTNDWKITSTVPVQDAFRAGIQASGYGVPYGKRPAW